MKEGDYQSLGQESKCEAVVEGETLFEVLVGNETITNFLEKSEANVKTKKIEKSEILETKEEEESVTKSRCEKQYSSEKNHGSEICFPIIFLVFLMVH